MIYRPGPPWDVIRCIYHRPCSLPPFVLGQAAGGSDRGAEDSASPGEPGRSGCMLTTRHLADDNDTMMCQTFAFMLFFSRVCIAALFQIRKLKKKIPTTVKALKKICPRCMIFDTRGDRGPLRPRVSPDPGSGQESRQRTVRPDRTAPVTETTGFFFSC